MPLIFYPDNIISDINCTLIIGILRGKVYTSCIVILKYSS